MGYFDDQSSLSDQLYVYGMATSIPFLLIGGVLFGYWAGSYATRFTEGEWPVLVGVLVGLAAGVGSTVRTLQKIISRTNDREEDDE